MEMFKIEKTNIEKHLLPQFVNPIQSNLFLECIQNQFLFLKDCSSKHVGRIVRYKCFLIGHPNT